MNRRPLFRLPRSRSTSQEVDDEIQTHLEMRTEQYIRGGMDPDAARRAARRQFADSTTTRRALYRAAHRRDRAVNRQRMFQGWVADFRHALRGLRRDARFTLFIAVTLSLGIGANAAMYGVIDRLLLRGPDHVERPDRLARLYLDLPGPIGAPAAWIPYPAYQHLSQSTTLLSDYAGYRVLESLVGITTEVRPRPVGTVTAGFFETLGVQPLVGRLLDDASWGERAAVLSHHVWVSEFGGRADAIGEGLELSNEQFTVVGVAPPGFTGPQLGPVDMWVPQNPSTARRLNWQVVARIAEGRTLDAAIDEAAAAYERASADVPTWARDRVLIGAPIRYDNDAKEPAEATISRFLMAVAVVVLVIAWANVTSLILARMTRRRQEVAIRLALGVGRWRLLRMLLVESLVLGSIGGLLSLPVAWFTGRLLQNVLLSQISWTSGVLSAPVLGLIALVSAVSGLMIGVIPALRAVYTDVGQGLRSSARTGPDRRRRWQYHGLTVLQTTLTAALLLGAGLFVQSLRTIRATDLGIDADGSLSVTLQALDPGQLNPGSDGERRAFEQALRTTQSMNGVHAAALAVGQPFFATFGSPIYVPGRESVPMAPGVGPFVSAIGPGYLDAIGTRILAGRGFTNADLTNGEPIAIVSESMARRLWDGLDAIGQCFRVGAANAPCARIVGVVGDIHRFGYREPASLQFYVPLGQQRGFSGLSLVARVRGRVADAVNEIEREIRAANPDVAYVNARTLRSFLGPQERPWRLGATVLTLCATLALLVAVAGVYGTLSYLVAQQRREIGLRMALGASRESIRRFIVKTGTLPAILGLSLGIGVALLVGRWVEPLLFETPVWHAPTILAVTIALLGAAVLACLVPALHASRIDPAGCLSE